MTTRQAASSSSVVKMKCISCQENKREIDDLKAKVAFLKFSTRSQPISFSDVVLVASQDPSAAGAPVPVPALKAVLASRSPVFRAMLENQMEESLSGTIRIGDISYDLLRAFVNYLYTAEICLDEEMACDLLILAEKYQVQHLKDYCEKFLVSKLNWDNSILSYTFAHQHNAKHIVDAALTLITDNMDKLTTREEYMELVEKDPRLVVEVYEAYLSKQINTAAQKDSSARVGPAVKPPLRDAFSDLIYN
ncbi:BTB/POZ domain-containing protein At4g08455-like [Rosa rugosa]|uniref:BTB/POZ domain-containing protein At4g08455-like n=1 Tax=Rosa rugosa TaxID=74645 RepID=UPI002B41831E|nr:BTB/POZ domain-containing protein At4g08455-like [Rosa rugosa]